MGCCLFAWDAAQNEGCLFLERGSEGMGGERLGLQRRNGRADGSGGILLKLLILLITTLFLESEGKKETRA